MADDKEHKTFRLVRNLVVQETYVVEAMHERHARARLRRLIDAGKAPEPIKNTVRVGHFKVEG